MLKEVILNSNLSDVEKADAAYFHNKFSKLPMVDYTLVEKWTTFGEYGDVPKGSVELFKAITNNFEDKYLELLCKAFNEIIYFENIDIEYRTGIYEKLQLITGGVFDVEKFNYTIDYENYDIDYPYKGFIEFYHKSKHWFYAPHYDIFEQEILNFLNYYLATSEITDKRFFLNCSFASKMTQGDTWCIVFATKQQFQWLKENHFIAGDAFDNGAFWNNPDKEVDFVSMKKKS